MGLDKCIMLTARCLSDGRVYITSPDRPGFRYLVPAGDGLQEAMQMYASLDLTKRIARAIAACNVAGGDEMARTTLAAIAEAGFVVVPAEANAALRAQVAELEAERAWRPIESAPMDGKRALLHRGGEVAIGRFVGDVLSPHSCPGFERWFRAAWEIGPQQEDEYVRVYWHGERGPTSWLPLPSPPTEGEA